MPWPGESRGEHDAPLPTGKRSLDERDAPLKSETTGQHLYLIFDDWPWGYSIRKLKLPPARSPHQRSLRALKHRLEPHQPELKPLPRPCICVEAKRCMPSFFAAVGTNILAAHPRYDLCRAECILPIIDVRSLGVSFGPGLLYSVQPIFTTVGDKVFALDMSSFKMLSTKPLSPPHEWSWCDLPQPPLVSKDCTSIAVGSDESTIFVSTDCATFAFDIVKSEWIQSSFCSLPFIGPAKYVHALDIFVGLSKEPDTYGHLCFCSNIGGNVALSKENLLRNEAPAESLVGATLLYLGGSEPRFCLVECISIAQGESVNMWLEKCSGLTKCVDEGDAASSSMYNFGVLDELDKFVLEGTVHYSYCYRLTTFSLSFDDNGDLTTGETCVVQSYKVPKGVSELVYHGSPVAFWL